MVRAWFMDTSDGDQRQDHQLNPPEYVDEEYLKDHGVFYWQLDADNYKKEGILDKIRTENGYTYEDQITISKDLLPEYEEKIKSFYKEHLHTDDEIRFCLDGSGYWDFRDKSDRWVRVAVTKGVLIALPAGIYHRFTLDTKNYLKAMRLFAGVHVWIPVYRPAEDNEARHNYVKTLKENGFAAFKNRSATRPFACCLKTAERISIA